MSSDLALENLGEIEDNLGEQEALPFVRYSITSYGADYTVDSLVTRLQKGSIYIPGFQRDYIWNHVQASHLIESFLLGLPVPGIFLSKDQSERLLVIDGQQRLKTLQAFYEGVLPDGRQFYLRDVQHEFEGKTYETLENSDQLRLDDSIIRATILQQNAPREEYSSSIYFIFRRLNTNTTPLTSQEIRAAIHEGPLNDLLVELDRKEGWHKLVGRRSAIRKRGQELILRFFAMFYFSDDYAGYRSMDSFLTDVMQKYEQAEEDFIIDLRQLFTLAFETVYEAVGPRIVFRRKVVSDDEHDDKVRYGPFNAAVFDSTMVGIANRLKDGPIENFEKIREKYDELMDLEDFQEATRAATGDAERVSRRLNLATRAFKDVK